ncbi:MAG: hypothetical protein R6V01_03070 [Thermoplasmatota archaeon]
MTDEAEALDISFLFEMDLDLEEIDSGKLSLFIGLPTVSRDSNPLQIPFDRDEVEDSIYGQLEEMEIPEIKYDLRNVIVKIWNAILDLIGEDIIDQVGKFFLTFLLGLKDEIIDSINIKNEFVSIYTTGGISFDFDFDLNSKKNVIDYHLFSFLKDIDDAIGPLIPEPAWGDLPGAGMRLCELLDHANNIVGLSGTKLITLQAVVSSPSDISIEKVNTGKMDISSIRGITSERRVIKGKFSDFSQKDIGKVTVSGQLYYTSYISLLIMLLVIGIVMAYLITIRFYIKERSTMTSLFVIGILGLIQSYVFPWSLYNSTLFYVISIILLLLIGLDTFFISKKKRFFLMEMDQSEDKKENNTIEIIDDQDNFIINGNETIDSQDNFISSAIIHEEDNIQEVPYEEVYGHSRSEERSYFEERFGPDYDEDDDWDLIQDDDESNEEDVWDISEEEKTSSSISKMKRCPYCGEKFNFKKTPKFCPFCEEELD